MPAAMSLWSNAVRAVLVLVLILAGLSPSFADGRAAWSGYYWRSTPYDACIAQEPSGCLTHRAKWDWKRDQWVELWYAPAPQGMTLSLRLTNNDRHDDDYVCVTALFVDAEGSSLAAYHVNLHIDPRTVEEDVRTIDLPVALLPRVARVDVGTKQCRQGAGQDDAIYKSVLSALPGSE